MHVQLKLNVLFERLRAVVKKIYGKSESRLHIYKGVILPELLDGRSDNILGQALNATPGRIQLVANIKLKINGNQVTTDPIDSAVDVEIRPVVKFVQNYINYFLTNHNSNQKGGKRWQISKRRLRKLQKEFRTCRRWRS